jgi:Uma2 family endonuclease
MMVSTKVKFTYDDYRTAPENERYELLEGELVMVPAPNFAHQNTSAYLAATLWKFVREHDLGVVLSAPFDVVLSEERVFQPDILFVSRERLSIINPENIRGTAPDLVVEILSPATAERDRFYKRAVYARYGVKEYWIVDPEASIIEVTRLGEKDLETVKVYGKHELLKSLLLEGLTVELDEVF